METRRVAMSESTDQGTHAVRVAHGESRMFHQLPDLVKSPWPRGCRLQTEPLVDDQRVILEPVVERGKSLLVLRQSIVHKAGQGRHAVGHVVGIDVLIKAGLMDLHVIEKREIGQAKVFQAAPSDSIGIGRVQALILHRRHDSFEVLGQFLCHGLAHHLSGGMDCNRVGHDHGLGQLRFRRQSQGQRQKCRVGLTVCQGGPESSHEGLRDLRFPILGKGGDNFQDHIRRQALPRFPAIEGITVVGKQERQVLMAVREAELDRSGKITQQRRDRSKPHIDEIESLFRCSDTQCTRASHLVILAGKL